MLENGETIRARAVVSNLNPKLLFGGTMVDDAQLPADFRESVSPTIAAARARSG